MALLELLQKADEGDFLRTMAEAVLQLFMEADVEGVVGAGRHERSAERANYRNGYRERTLDTRLGPLQLRIPKLRQGSYFPPFLEPRKTSEKALVAVIQEAWISGVSTRRVDDLVQAPPRSPDRVPCRNRIIGLLTNDGTDRHLEDGHRSQEAIDPAAKLRSSGDDRGVSKLCKEIDERVNAFLDRPLEGDWPYLWLDATYLKQGEGGRIVSVAAPTLPIWRRGGQHRRTPRDHRSSAVDRSDSRRERRQEPAEGACMSGHDWPAGQSSDSWSDDGQQAIEGEAETFWSTFLKKLVKRGLSGVKLVISDAHEGLKHAIARVLGSTPPPPPGGVPFGKRMNGLLPIHG